ncbi:MAG: hypothetical protein AABX71_00200, partial [Nanoarchaeota archaeon]
DGMVELEGVDVDRIPRTEARMPYTPDIPERDSRRFNKIEKYKFQEKYENPFLADSPFSPQQRALISTYQIAVPIEQFRKDMERIRRLAGRVDGLVVRVEQFMDVYTRLDSSLGREDTVKENFTPKPFPYGDIPIESPKPEIPKKPLH